MESQLMSLSSLFNNTLFRIPDYQRGYAWGEKEYVAFWNDIERFDVNNNYYMGVITTDKISKETMRQSSDYWIVDPAGYSPLYVVDGQQRLTSLVILLAAIINVATQQNQKIINFNDIKTIKELFLAKPKGNSTTNYTAIFDYSEGNSSKDFFEKNILDLPSTDDDKIIMNKYNRNLLEVYNYFLGNLKDLSTENINTLYSKVTTKVVFNMYQITHDVNIFVTFETMNNRGKGLSTLELLKNRLIYLSTLFPGKSISSGPGIRQEINSCWKKIYDYLGKNPDKMLPDDDFLMAHTTAFFFNNQDGNKIDHLNYFRNGLAKFLLDTTFTDINVQNEKLSPDYIFKYIASLNASIKIWYMLNFPIDKEVKLSMPDAIRIYLIKINFLADQKLIILNGPSEWQSISLLYFLKTNDTNQRLHFLKQLERTIFITRLASINNYTLVVHHLSPVIHRLEMSKKNNIDDIKDFPRSLSFYNDKLIQGEDFRSSINQLCSYLSNNGFYESGRSTFPTKYLLACYIIDLSNKAKETLTIDTIYSLFFKTDNSHEPSLEHIYPRSVTSKTGWNNHFKQYNQTKKNKIKNSLGNLVLIDRVKNDKLQNESFAKKKDQGNVCFANGNIDERNIAKNDDWTLKEIKARGLDIFNFINNNWNIKIPKDMRIEFIGLGKIQNSKNSLNSRTIPPKN